MTQILSDGTVLPSYLSVHSGAYADGQFDNIALRVGEVKEILYPDNPRSLSKKFTEYVVSVQMKDGAGVGVPIVYPNCIVAQQFGGVADYFTYTLRADDGSTQGDTTKAGLGNGSLVLLLCLNGETSRPFIIGGFPVNDDDSDAALEHNLHFRFNGINVEVNKDGELSVSFQGATDAAGELAEGVDSEASGSELFLCQGRIGYGHLTGWQSIH
jgi:hypothetical protein